MTQAGPVRRKRIEDLPTHQQPDIPGTPMVWYVYLLECTDGSIYTGISVDVAKRYAAHVAGRGARYTRSHPPARLLASVAYVDRASASRAEYAMKQLSATQKRAAARQAAKRSKKKPK